MEDVGEEYFRILTSRLFFQPSPDESCFIMHDCVHDLATFVLGDFGFRLEENKNLHNLPSKTRHLSIMEGMISDEQRFDGISNAKCLRTLLSLGSYAIYPPLMEEGCLRVLSLCNFSIAELPESIGNFKHLRYLDASFLDIKEIPDTICTLYNLETLLLKECTRLAGLPTDIGRLIKLRHLDFSYSSIKELPLIFNMKDLQTIQPGFILGKEHADSTIKDVGCFQNLRGWLNISRLENVVNVKDVCEAKLRDKKFITVLGLFWHDDPCLRRDVDSMEEREVLVPQELGLLWDGDSDDSMKEREILDQLQPHTNLKKLEISCYPGTRFSDWMGDQSFYSIVEVKLFKCEDCRSLWPLDQLPSLKTLRIWNSFRRVETINWEFFSNSSSMTKPFRSLQVLQFFYMPGWKEWLFREGEGYLEKVKLFSRLLRSFYCLEIKI